MLERLKRWFTERGIDPIDVAGILAFSGLVFGRLYAWLDLEWEGDGEKDGWRSWISLTGGLLFAVLAITIVSGLLLLFYYNPTPDSAQASIRYLENEVMFGRTVRQVHAWSASIFIFLIFVHLFRCFVWRSYGRPKDLNWIVGAVLLFLSFYFILTGRLLPWDQYAYWKTVANIDVLWKVPLVGSFLVKVLYGGEDVTWLTLIRFYSAHILVLPLVSGGFLLLHFALLKRHGTSSSSAEGRVDNE